MIFLRKCFISSKSKDFSSEFYLLSITNVVFARYGIMHRFKRYHGDSSKEPKYNRIGSVLRTHEVDRRTGSPAVSPGQWNTGGPLFKRRPTFRRVQIDPELIDHLTNYIEKKSDLTDLYRQSLI